MSVTTNNPEALGWKYPNVGGISTVDGVITEWPDSLPELTQDLNDIQAQEDDGDIIITLSDYFSDVDSNELFYSYEESLSSVQLSINSDILIIQFLDNLYAVFISR